MGSIEWNATARCETAVARAMRASVLRPARGLLSHAASVRARGLTECNALRAAPTRGLPPALRSRWLSTPAEAALDAAKIAPPAAAGPAETVSITFIEEGEEVPVEAEVGATLLEVAQANDVDLEGACDGSLACSTCHLVMSQSHFDGMPEPDEEELDMLDLAFGLEDTSRLGCQIKVTKQLDGLVAKLPGANFG